MVWFKRDCGMTRNRKLMAAAKEAHGLATWFLWEEILSINAESSRDGRLSLMDVRPDLMEMSLGAWGITEQIASDSFQAFLKNGLLEESEGSYVIVGWDDFRPNLTSAEKQKRHRKKKSELGSCGTEPVTRTGNGRYPDRVTPLPGPVTTVTPRQSRKTEEKEKRDRAEAEGSARNSPRFGVAVCSDSDLPQATRKKTSTVAITAMLHDLGYHPKSKNHRAAMAEKLSNEFCTLDDLALIGMHSQQDKIENPAAFLATGLDGDWRKRLDEAEKWRHA